MSAASAHKAAGRERAEHNKLSIFKSVIEVYAECGDRELSNKELYEKVIDKAGITEEDFSEKKAIGRDKMPHNPMARTARWVQQTMKQRKLLERVPGKRSFWTLTAEGKHRLRMIDSGPVLVGFSTKLGIGLWADCRSLRLPADQPVHLLLSSPPYPIAKGRAYGVFAQETYVDFICSAIEPILKNMVDGASLVLNLGRDIFEPKSPARSILNERLIIALYDRLGLRKMDNVPWINMSKAPGPIQWASLNRVQLNSAVEDCLWMTTNPAKVRSCNNRVLQDHDDRHLKLIARGGEARAASYADGRHAIRKGSFSNPTPGRIPRNVLMMGSHCPSQRRYKKDAAALGLPVHGAPFPVRLADFFIKFLTEEGDTVVDNMAGSLTVGVSAEALKRKWICVERAAEYLRGSVTRFNASDVWINPELDRLFGFASGPQSELVLA